MADDSPLTPSADYQAMSDYWALVGAILGGVDALRSAGSGGNVAGPHVPYQNLSMLRRTTQGESPYLPQYPNETSGDYEVRRAMAPLTNIYSDVSGNLASKPFSRECSLAETEPERLKKISENMDGQGHNLHVFAATAFKNALDKGLHWILVDYNAKAPAPTLQDERDMGARPYWCHIDAERMVAAYSVFFQGKESFIHARISEPVCRRDGYREYMVNRVRELNREALYDAFGNVVALGAATWRILEEQEVTVQGQATKDRVWVEVERGVFSIGFIPLVAVVIGDRSGTSWRVEPKLRNIADMQITSFQREADLQYAGVKTAAPVLVGEGIPAPQDGGELVIKTGPNSVLLAPPGGDGKNGTWKYIEITATSLAYLATRIDKLHTEMRDLGLQPLTTSNLTVITTANVSAKAHNAVQAWAIGLKDALEQAWKITCAWLNEERQPVVDLHTDFGIELESGKEIDALLKAEGQSVISKRTVQDEFKRRGVLSDDFDPDEEEERLAEQQQGLAGEQMIDPITGKPIPTDPATGLPLPPQDAMN